MRAAVFIAAALAVPACSGEADRPPAGGPDAAVDPVLVTIRQVQDAEADGWVAPGTLVRIEDVVVTARGNLTDDFTVQDDRPGEAPFSGLYIEVAEAGGELVAPIQGDRVSLVGVVSEREGDMTALADLRAIEALAAGAPLPEPFAVGAGELSGALDGVLVRIDGPHEVVTTDGEAGVELAGGLSMGTTFFTPDPMPGPGDVYAALTGPLAGPGRILPRSEGDLAGHVVAAHLVRILPDVFALAPGQSRVLALQLDAPAPAAFTVCLDSDRPAVAGPTGDQLAVAAGEAEVALEVRALSAHAEPATVRAWRAIRGSCDEGVGALTTAQVAVTDDRIAGPGDLRVNEVLSDPPGTESTDMAGDASCDGLRSSDDDEYVEIVNLTADVVDLSGVTLLDRVPEPVVRHVFAPATKLGPGEVILVYGAAPGPAATGPWCAVLAVVQVVAASAGSGLDLNNAGDTVRVLAADGAEITRFDYSALIGAHNQSITRDPDVSGGPVLYGNAASHLDDRAFSPGTRNDGSAFP